MRQPLPPHVRFPPRADKKTGIALSPLSATSGLMQRSKEQLYSITSDRDEIVRHPETERLHGLEIDD